MKNKVLDAPIKFEKIVMIMTKGGIALADASRKQKFLKKTWKLFRASCRTSSLRNFNHYNGKTIFFTAKHSPVFVGLVFNIGTLEIFGSLKDSVVDCRRLILSRYQYRTNKATIFYTSLQRNSGQYILNTSFHSCKALAGFLQVLF